MKHGAEQPHSQPGRKENPQPAIEEGEGFPEKKEFGRAFFQAVKEFIKRDWEETRRRRQGNKEKKRTILGHIGRNFVTGLVIVAALSTTPGKKVFVELANGLKKWNPGNLQYRIPDTWEYLHRGISQQEEVGETKTSVEMDKGTEFKMGKRTFRFYDSVLGLVRAFREAQAKNGDTKIEITNENTRKLLAFEYASLKPPKDPQAFREFLSFYTKRTLERRRADQRKRFLLDAIMDGKIHDPFAREAYVKLQLLWADSEKDYEVKEKEEIVILRTLEEHLLKNRISIGYPDSMLPYDQNPGPQSMEELLVVAQRILKENLEYDPAVESWLKSDGEGGGGIKVGDGNYLIDMYSANGIPVDVLLQEKKTGVCRHYADAFAAVFRELQEMFPGKFENVYVTTSTSVFRLHKYNTVFVVESPDVLHAISYEPQNGGVGEFHNTPAFEILEDMYARNYISKEDFYAAAVEYFSHRGVESRVDLLAFLDRLKGDRGELARAAGKGVLDAVEYAFSMEVLQEKHPRLKAHALYSKLKFLQETEEYRNAFGYN